MLGSEKQVTEPERAGKKDVKFPGKQKRKNGQKFYILTYKEMATLSQGSLISLLKMSTQKKSQIRIRGSSHNSYVHLAELLI